MSTPSSKPLAGAGSALLILTALNLLNYIDRYVPSAVKELVKVDLNLTDTQTALPLTSFVWVYMLASPIFGSLADRVSRPKLIAAGVLLWSLATAGAAFCTSFTSFLRHALTARRDAILSPREAFSRVWRASSSSC